MEYSTLAQSKTGLIKKQDGGMITHLLRISEGEVPVSQRPIDGYINATQLCQSVGKLFGHWRETDWAQEYLDELSRSIGITIDPLIVIVNKGPNDKRGTWVHPQVALRIAQWLSPRVAVQVDKFILAWSKGEIGTDLNTRSIIRMLLYPTAMPCDKRFTPDFYCEMCRLYHIPWNPRQGAPRGMYAASLTDKLIYARFPAEIRQAIKDLNPVIDEDGRREYKNYEYCKSDLHAKLDFMIDQCTRIMRQFSDKNRFEVAWDRYAPRQDDKQMLLLPLAFYSEDYQQN